MSHIYSQYLIKLCQQRLKQLTKNLTNLLITLLLIFRDGCHIRPKEPTYTFRLCLQKNFKLYTDTTDTLLPALNRHLLFHRRIVVRAQSIALFFRYLSNLKSQLMALFVTFFTANLSLFLNFSPKKSHGINTCTIYLLRTTRYGVWQNKITNTKDTI